jgi:hypothetical protein
MAKASDARGMAHDGWSTRNFEDLFRRADTSIPVAPSAPVGQQGGTSPAPQPPAPAAPKG